VEQKTNPQEPHHIYDEPLASTGNNSGSNAAW
jgi:hypothetical protein